MPAINIAVYLNDKDYIKYSKKKVKYNEIARTALQKELEK